MKHRRLVLATLHMLVALNAFGGGYYALSGANAVPVEWLEGSPFDTYFIPGLFLFVVIGGLSTSSAVAILTGKRYAAIVSMISAIILLCWILIQVQIIGLVSWLQPAICLIALLMLFFTHRFYRRLK